MELLKLGSKGALVEQLQKDLNQLGGSFKKLGIFNKKTDLFVRAYQLKNGLYVDGVVGPITWGHIQSNIKKFYVHGIDVSLWNGNLDWQKLKSDGVQFAFIKVSEGLNIKDPFGASNIQKAQLAGIPIGTYHFYRFWSDPVLQAKNFAAVTINHKDKESLPPVLDVEWQDNKKSSNDAIIQNRDMLLSNLKICLEQIEKLCKRTPMIYTQASFWDGILGAPKGFEKYKLWVVDYVNSNMPLLPSTWSEWVIWQYASTGKHLGCATYLDLNTFHGNLEEFNKTMKG